jgi:hypothetical protein
LEALELDLEMSEIDAGTVCGETSRLFVALCRFLGSHKNKTPGVSKTNT